jgi:ribosomal-protein-alanine N-acetyltransferase
MAMMGGVVHEIYFLKSERVGFRLWSKEDLPLARELWGDSEVTRYFGGPFSEEEIAERLELEISRMEKYGFQYWPIHLLTDDKHVGCCGLRPYRLEEGIPEFVTRVMSFLRRWG